MNNNINIMSLIRRRPQAYARLSGSPDFPKISGSVYFYQTKSGVFVITQVSGLPTNSDKCAQPVFAFHIHSGGSCSGNEKDPFADAMTHYNPDGCRHPYHAGDMPPLFGAGGIALSGFLTDRFSVREVIGKTVVIHALPDDFTTQPAGNSGTKIACGEIRN